MGLKFFSLMDNSFLPLKKLRELLLHMGNISVAEAMITSTILMLLIFYYKQTIAITDDV